MTDSLPPDRLAAGERSVFVKGAAMLMRATLILSLMLGSIISSSGQTRPANLKPGSAEAKALTFFEQIENRSFDDYLKRVRLPKVSQAFKAEVLARIARGEEAKTFDGMSTRMKQKLAGLELIRKRNRLSTSILMTWRHCQRPFFKLSYVELTLA